MPRVKRGTKRRAKRKKILDRASGYYLTKSKLYRSAKEAVDKWKQEVDEQLQQQDRETIKQAYVKLLEAQKKINKDTLDVDIFSPPREDWLNKTDDYLRQK